MEYKTFKGLRAKVIFKGLIGRNILIYISSIIIAIFALIKDISFAKTIIAIAFLLVEYLFLITIVQNKTLWYKIKGSGSNLPDELNNN